MAKYAVMDGDVIVNVVEAESDFATARGWMLNPEGAGVGWEQDGENFNPPPLPET